MADRRFTDFGAKSGSLNLTDMLLLSDSSNNYAYLTLQRLRTWIREEVTRSDKGTCSTAAATSAKTATLSDFKQADGKTVLLTFENAVGSGATLSINSTTAKPIFYHGAAIGDGVIGAGDTALLVYDTSADSGSGAYELITVDRSGKPENGWLETDLAAAVQAKLNLVGGIAANTQAASVTARTVSISDYKLTAGALVTVRFSYAVPANATLNVSSTGAKAIYYGTAAITAGIISAGMTVTFRYDGSYYRVVAFDKALTNHQSLSQLGCGYTVCTSLDEVTQKTAALEGYVMREGGLIAVKFSYPVNAGATMNINNTQDVPLYWQGSPISSGLIAQGDTGLFVFDGDHFELLSVNKQSTDTTPSGGTTTLPELGGGYASSGNSASTAARTATISGYVLTTGNGPTIKFTNAVNAANATLNINDGTSNTGAKAIWYRGAAIPAGVIEAGALVKFVYDGTHYCVESIDNVPNIWGFDSSSQYSSASSTIPVGDYVMYPVSGRLHLFRKNSGGLTDLWTFPAFYIKDAAGIPQTDLAKETVTITAVSGTPVTYTSSKTFAQISAAKTAGKEIEVVFNGFAGRCIDVGQNAATFEVIDATSPSAPVQYIFVVSGSGCAGAASNWGSSGGGAEVFSVAITTGTGASSTKTAAEIYAAKQAGKIIQATVDGIGAELAESSSNEAIFRSVETDSGRYLVETTVTGSTVSSSRWPIGNVNLPTAQTKTAAAMANGFSVAANNIYNISDTISGFAITNQSITFTPGLCAEIILTVGSTAITTPTWPTAAKFMDGWDGKFSANTEYDIIIDWGGRVYHSERAVSA